MNALDWVRWNPLDHPICFMFPERNSPILNWWGHIPFAASLVSALRPRRVVELGVDRGDSLSAFSQTTDVLDLPTEVIGIDSYIGDEQVNELITEEEIQEVFNFFSRRFPKTRLLKKSFDEALTDIEDNSISLLHIDGNHRFESVSHDYETWLPKLAPDGVVLFHDIAISGPLYGVDRFWKTLKTQHPYFEFFHSWGLGVLAPKEIPPSLRPLFLATGTEDEEKIQTFYQLLGARIHVFMLYRKNYGEHLLLEALSSPTLVSDPSQTNVQAEFIGGKDEAKDIGDLYRAG